VVRVDGGLAAAVDILHVDLRRRVARAQQEAFVSSDAEQMKFLTDKPFGRIYWLGRWALLVYKKQVGGRPGAEPHAVAVGVAAAFR